MNTVALIALLALIQYIWFTTQTGMNRPKMGVKAPHVTGNEEWERLFRIQQNTLEQLIVFLPALYIFAHYLSAQWALIPGGVFIIGRQLYARAYRKDPSKRVLGMVITFAANVVLVLGGLFAVILSLF